MTADSAPARMFDGGAGRAAADLLVCGSMEMSPDRANDAAALAALLPSGIKVYVNHLPRHGLAQSLTALTAQHEAGLDPVPHIAARRVGSRAEVESFLEQAVSTAGVSRVLLIGGDDPQPLGPYADGLALLREGDLAQHGVKEVGLPGYPEGHPRIPRATLEQALADKIALAADQGIGAFIVTQFSFAPARIVEYCNELARTLPAVAVYVGMAGPTSAATLLRFAQRCGVSASLRALQAQGMGAVRMLTHTDPGDQLTAVAHYCVQHTTCNVVGAHLFSFGNATKTAEWINRAITARRAV